MIMDTHLSDNDSNTLKIKSINVYKDYNIRYRKEINLYESIKEINTNQKSLVIVEDHVIIKNNNLIYLYIDAKDIDNNRINIEEFIIVIDDIFDIKFDINYDNIENKFIIQAPKNNEYNEINLLSNIPAGKYILKLVINGERYYSYIEIEKKINCSTWKNMVNFLEKEINGLAYSIAWKNQGLTLDKNSSDMKSINKKLYPLYLIETYSDILISVLTDLNEKPKHKVEKIYVKNIHSKSFNNDIVTLRKNSRNSKNNLYKYTYNKQITYDIEENRILKKIIKFINSELVSIIKLLKKNIDTTTEKFRTRYLKYLNSSQKLINIINIIQYSEWYKEISDTTSGYIPHSLVLDSRYGTLYKIYNELLNPIESINFNSNFYEITKTSNLLYEIWCYIGICKLFENDEEYTVTKDFFNQYEHEIYPELKENTMFIVENDDVCLHINYNKTLKNITNSDLDNLDININTEYNDVNSTIIDNEVIENYLTKDLNFDNINKNPVLYGKFQNIINYNLYNLHKQNIDLKELFNNDENIIKPDILNPFYTIGFNNKPDITIDIYSKNSDCYIGSIVVECKYRSFNSYWNIYEKFQKQGTCNHQVNSYSNDTRVNPFIENHYFNLDIDSRPVKKVFILSPNIKNEKFNLPTNPCKSRSIIHLEFQPDEDINSVTNTINSKDNNLYNYIDKQIEHMNIKYLELYKIMNNNLSSDSDNDLDDELYNDLDDNSTLTIKNIELEKKISELENELERIKKLNSSICNEFESLEEAEEYCERYVNLLDIDGEFKYMYYRIINDTNNYVWVIYIKELLIENIETLIIPDFVYGLNVYKNGVNPLNGSGRNYQIGDFSQTLLIEQTSLKSIELGKGIRDLTGLFHHCKISKELCENIAIWDVSNIISCRNMFNTAEWEGNLDLSNWATPKLEDIDYIFYGALTSDKDNIPAKYKL